jgi:hypothetical protein
MVSIVAGLFFLGAGEPTEASWVCVAPAITIFVMGSMKKACVLMNGDCEVDVFWRGRRG